MTRSGRKAGAACGGLAALAAALGLSCAPRLASLPEREPETVSRRYEALLAKRQGLGAAVGASLLLWAERPAERRLPGAQGDLFLAAPDRFRLRVGSLFGTAVDVGGHGDSLAAYVPAWRSGLVLGSSRDSLEVGDPGAMLYRVLSATWAPPQDAWRSTVAVESLTMVAWVEGGDSLILAVGRGGLPVWAAIRRAGFGARASYRGWDRSGGAAWPAHIELEDEQGALRVKCKVSQLRFLERADPERLSVRLPEGAEILTLARLRAALERLGVL